MINHWNWGAPVLHKHINQQENWEYDSGTSQQQTYTKKKFVQWFNIWDVLSQSSTSVWWAGDQTWFRLPSLYDLRMPLTSAPETSQLLKQSCWIQKKSIWPMRKSVVSREPTKNVRYLTATSTTKDDTSESKLYSERTGQCKHLQDDLSNKSSIGMDQDPPCYPSTSKELVLRKNTVFIHKYQYNIYILHRQRFWPPTSSMVFEPGLRL